MKYASRQSRKFAHNRRKKVIGVCALCAISVISWIFAVSGISYLAVFDIQDIKIFGADNDINDSLYSAAIKAIDGNYLGLFSKSNAYIYPKRAITQAIKNASFRVNDVSVNRAGTHSLNIEVREKNPAAVICLDLPDWNGPNLIIDNLDSCYRVDNAGFAFAEATSSDAALNRYYMPNIADANSSGAVVGSSIASAIVFNNLQSFYNAVSSNGIDVKAILVKAGGEYELYAANPSIMDGQSRGNNTSAVVVYFNKINDFNNELSALISFWNNMIHKTEGQTAIPQFDSIDLRSGSNIFYR
jgi:hypothetical protein